MRFHSYGQLGFDMKKSIIKFFFIAFLLCLLAGCVQMSNTTTTGNSNQTSKSIDQENYTRSMEISDQINLTALSIALNNSLVKSSLSGANYSVTNIGPGTLISSSINGEEKHELMRVDIETDKMLLTIWIDINNQSVVYINDYPKRSTPPTQ